MDTSDLGIFKAVAGKMNKKANRTESTKRYRSSDEIKFQEDIYNDDEENYDPERFSKNSLSRNYDHLDSEYKLARESPDKRSRLEEDLLNASHTTELSTFYAEDHSSKDKIERFEELGSGGALQGIKRRVLSNKKERVEECMNCTFQKQLFHRLCPCPHNDT